MRASFITCSAELEEKPSSTALQVVSAKPAAELKAAIASKNKQQVSEASKAKPVEKKDKKKRSFAESTAPAPPSVESSGQLGAAVSLTVGAWTSQESLKRRA